MGKLKWIQLPIQAAKYANKALDKDGAGLTVIELKQSNLNLNERFTSKKDGVTVLTPLLFKGDIVAKVAKASFAIHVATFLDVATGWSTCFYTLTHHLSSTTAITLLLVKKILPPHPSWASWVLGALRG